MKKPLILIFCLFLAACAKTEGTSTGNPLVAVQFQSFTAMGEDAQAITELKMCFKRLRLKTQSAQEENIDLILGETSISASGTLLTTTTIPAGTYRRVEFDLYSGCASGKSLQITNTNGSYSTNDVIKIRFDGTLVLTASQDLNLNIQAIVNALKNVSANGDIKADAESASGSF